MATGAWEAAKEWSGAARDWSVGLITSQFNVTYGELSDWVMGVGPAHRSSLDGAWVKLFAMDLADSKDSNEVTLQVIRDFMSQTPISATTLDAKSILHLVAMSDSAHAIRPLVSSGASLTAVDDTGMTPYLSAARSGATRSLAILEAIGASTTIKDANGDNALVHAVLSGNPSTVRLVGVTPAKVADAESDSGQPLLVRAARACVPGEVLSLLAESTALQHETAPALEAAALTGCSHAVGLLARLAPSISASTLEVLATTSTDASAIQLICDRFPAVADIHSVFSRAVAADNLPLARALVRTMLSKDAASLAFLSLLDIEREATRREVMDQMSTWALRVIVILLAALAIALVFYHKIMRETRMTIRSVVPIKVE